MTKAPKNLAAATLLEETRLPITQIAANIGFGGVDAFHRKFKEKYGLTPVRYRERFRRSDPVPRRLSFDFPELRTR